MMLMIMIMMMIMMMILACTGGLQPEVCEAGVGAALVTHASRVQTDLGQWVTREGSPGILMGSPATPTDRGGAEHAGDGDPPPARAAVPPSVAALHRGLTSQYITKHRLHVCNNVTWQQTMNLSARSWSSTSSRSSENSTNSPPASSLRASTNQRSVL